MLDVVDAAITVIVFFVADFWSARIDGFVFVVTVTVCRELVTIAVFELDTCTFTTEEARSTVGITDFFADPFIASFAVTTSGDTDLLANTFVTDIAKLWTGRDTLFSQHTLPT